jgi:hypothetical protein
MPRKNDKAKPKPKPAAKKPRAVVSLAQRTRATGRGGRGR